MFLVPVRNQYSHIKSPFQANSNRKLTKEKWCVISVLITSLLIAVLVLIPHHQHHNNKPPNTYNLDINSERISKTVLTTEEIRIGHKLSCPNCCDPNINFTKWLKVSPPNTKYKLLQSHYLTRHGDRTQLWNDLCWDQPFSLWQCNGNSINTVILPQAPLYGFTIHTINNTNLIPGNCQIGQLTPNGYKQLFNHGNKIRERYMNYYQLIPKQLNHLNVNEILSKIRLRADHTQRCQESIMAFFLGLYPNYKHLKHQISIPLYVEDPTYEIITDSNPYICPYLNDIVYERESSDLWNHFINDIAMEINESVSDILQSDSAGYYEAFDCGTVHLCHDYNAPITFSQELFEDAQQSALWVRLYQGVFPDYVNATKYHVGPLLKLIYFRFKYMIDSQTRNNYNNNDVAFVSNLYVYGAHDTGPIMPLLSAFQYNLTEWVAYAATITMELFQNNSNEYFILISYNGKPLFIPQCNNHDTEYNLCEWIKFEKWMKEIIPTEEECPNTKLSQYLTQNV